MTRAVPRAGDKPAESPWAPYVPDQKVPWDLRRVVHLHRRAGFAATWAELQRDLKEGLEASVNRLLEGTAGSDATPPDFRQTADLLGRAAGAGSGAEGRLKAWWVYRMLFGPDPLGERLTLMWHNHFATSNLKVDDLDAMRRQNEQFRTFARAPFGELLNAAVRDPALLAYLDAPSNRKGHPNENLARELMELFTLGIGHYTEADVKEAARALTGWTVADGAFREDAATHDAGEKGVLGRRGRWSGGDLVKILLDDPATARRLARRVCELFFGERAVKTVGIDALARGLREHELDVGWAVATVLRSRAFFADDNLGDRVLGPVEYVLGAARGLEQFEPPSSTLVLAEWVTRLGQDLFHPPNVGGWPGGRSWLTARALVGRANFAAALAGGRGVGRPEPLDALGLARRHGRGRDREAVVTFYTVLLRGVEPDAAWRDRLAAGLPKDGDEAGQARRIVALILAMPEAQVA